MQGGLLEIFSSLPVFALTVFRIGGMFLTAPLFAASAVPMRIRAATATALSLIVFPVVLRQLPQSIGFGDVLAAGIGEMLVGLVLGLVFAALLVSAHAVGTIAAQQAGLALSETINPLSDSPTSILAQLYLTIVTCSFLAAGGLQAMVCALLDSYQVIPALGFTANNDALTLLVDALSLGTQAGIRLAGPILLALFMTETAMAVISRTVPQLNILSVGFALRGLVGLGIMAMSVTASRGVLLELFPQGIGLLRSALGLPDNPWGGMNAG